MALLALKLLLAPAFVIAASLCTRRWGAAVGGVIGGLPMVAAPILLVMALMHGDRFGADAATASLLGLVSLAAFVITYSVLCPRVVWWLLLPIGWVAFLVCAGVLSFLPFVAPAALVFAFGVFAAALRALPLPRPGAGAAAMPPWDLPVRGICAALMVLALTGASSTLGAHLAGLLAPFPIITSVLGGFAHAQRGPEEARAVLRGMLRGFFGFASFCAIVGIALPTLGVAATFSLAVLAALLVNGSALAIGAGDARFTLAGEAAS